jgi:dTDP-4-amino-4,6-dideoxygalactose transaminase
MEFIDLKAQQARIKDRIDARIAGVLAHGRYIMGPEVKELEQALAAFTGARHCIGCAPGTNALELVLAAWGIGEGDAVFTSPLSFIATAETIAKTGAVPVFVDIDPDTYNLDASRLEDAVMAVRERDRSRHPLPRAATERQLAPRAVVMVDLFGNPVDYDAALAVARRHHLLTLEDGAQALGGSYKGQRLCNCGCDAATTSFFPAKPLGCYGDGGAVFTNDAELAALVDSLRYHGRVNAQNKNDNIRLGGNGRLDTLQAAILLAKLEIFPEEMELRAAAGRRYAELLAPYADHPGIVAPRLTAGGSSIWAQYTVRLPQCTNRPAVMQALKEQGIPTAINYPKGMHTQGCLRHLGYTPHDFPQVQDACTRVLSLPMHPYLTETDQKTIVEALVRAVGA